MNNKLEVIGIDHGWSMMKTISQVFVTGVKEITTTPALFGDVLEYEGKFYKVGTVRQEVKDTKVEDDSFYLLTLAAVAKELKRRGLAEAKVFLAVGLPLTRFGAEKNDFIKYLTKNKRVRLLDIRENVRGAIKTTDKDIAKTALLAKGFREAGQTVANAFRTFADKPEVDYSQKKQKHPITKAVLAPIKAVKKMLVSMELHLDASIDKLDNLAMNVKLDKEKHMENAKVQEQTEPERAEAERVEAEIVYSPMVAEPQEYQYNADAFEARGVDEVKQEATHKEVSKVREDKAR